jgi:hypothetical protein
VLSAEIADSPAKGAWQMHVAKAHATLALHKAWEECECQDKVKLVIGGEANLKGVVVVKACKKLQLVPLSPSMHWVTEPKTSSSSCTFPNIKVMSDDGQWVMLNITAPPKQFHVPFFHVVQTQDLADANCKLSSHIVRIDGGKTNVPIIENSVDLKAGTQLKLYAKSSASAKPMAGAGKRASTAAPAPKVKAQRR